MKERVHSHFFRDLFTLRETLDTLWRADEPSPPPVLYHYTSATAARGILQSRQIWATITSALNDEKELVHGAGVLTDELNARAVSAVSGDERLLFAKELTDFDYTRSDILHVFAASLSAAEDDRPQWQLYAEGGYGVALGFDGAALAQLPQANGAIAKFGLGRVLYDDSSQRRFVNLALDEWFARARSSVLRNKVRVRNGAYYLAGLFSYLATCMYGYLPMLKDPHFVAEAEWRMAHAHDPSSTTCCSVKHRGVDSTSYVEFPLADASGRIPLTSLWLGPGVATDESYREARKALDDLGYVSTAVRTSLVPLRLDRRTIAF